MVDHLGKEELHHLTARGVSEGRRGVRVRVSEVCVRGWGDGVSGGGACRYITVTLPLHYRAEEGRVRCSHSTGAWREHALLWYVHHSP